MKREDKYRDLSEREWEQLASALSGESLPENGETSQLAEAHSLVESEMWGEMARSASSTGRPDVDAAWNKLYGRLESENLLTEPAEERSIRRIIPGFVRIAASIILVLGLGYVSYTLFRSGPDKILTAYSGNEKNMVVGLPDGSHVTLNRNTTLTYPSRFDDNSRAVTISGEGFFEVEPDPSSPFRVRAGKADIEVLGTSFNINSSTEGNNVEVLVQTGRVLFTAEGDSEGIVLTKGYLGTTAGGTPEMHLNNNPNYLAWKSGILVYEAAELESVISDLQKVYGITIILDESVTSGKLLTTVLDNVPEEEVIEIISATFNLTWKKEGIVYLLSHQ
ncbi:MAG: FecR domain-containing protein [Bacteroidales bacterium]|nr:FecR domain-containing protein [Bacteroidales bacterium]